MTCPLLFSGLPLPYFTWSDWKSSAGTLLLSLPDFPTTPFLILFILLLKCSLLHHFDPLLSPLFCTCTQSLTSWEALLFYGTYHCLSYIGYLLIYVCHFLLFCKAYEVKEFILFIYRRT